MIKIRNRRIALLLVLTMLATMFACVGTASAATTNKVVGAVPTIADATNLMNLAKLSIKAGDAENITSGDVFVLTLPSGVEWPAAPAAPVTLTYSNDDGSNVAATAVRVTGKVVNITVNTTANDADDTIIIQPHVKIATVGSGELKVNLAAPGTAIAAGDYTLGLFASKGASVVALSTPSRGAGDKEFGTIRITENSADSITAGETITVKLPTGITWNLNSANWAGTITGTNGRTATVTTATNTNNTDRLLTLTFNAIPAGAGIGIYDLRTLVNVDSDDAAKSDVVASLGGNADVSGDVTIGKYSDYKASVKIASVKELKAGKFEQKTDEITIEEGIAGTFLTNRDLTIKVPSWVLITGVPESNTADFAGSALGAVPGDKSKVDITIGTPTTTTAGKIKLKLQLSIQGDKTGDIEATISGAGVEEQKVVIAKAVAPAGITTALSSELKVGVQDQKISDIVIAEGIKEGIVKNYLVTYGGATNTDGTIKVTLTEGVVFSKKPTVKVTEGNLEIDADNINLDSNNSAILNIPIKGDSTKISKLTVSDIYVTLNRSVPEGSIYAKLGGLGIIENCKANGASATTVNVGEFDVSNIQKVEIAKVVTPAPDKTTYNTSSFVLGASKYILNGKEVEAVAPSFAKNNRTYLAIRDVAHALGIDDNNIVWNQNDKTVTLIKGERLVQLAMGSNIIKVNGLNVYTMDVVPEVASDRTFLPAAWVAQAFGAAATWDAATQTVTIK